MPNYCEICNEKKAVKFGRCEDCQEQPLKEMPEGWEPGNWVKWREVEDENTI